MIEAAASALSPTAFKRLAVRNPPCNLAQENMCGHMELCVDATQGGVTSCEAHAIPCKNSQ